MAATAAPTWDEEQEARLAALLEAQHGGETLDAFVRRVSPRHPPPDHVKPLIDLWEATRVGRVFACVELPPRHAKTTTGLHGIAWRLKRDPAVTNAFATFGDDYAASRSRIARVLTRAGGVSIARDMANLHEWRTNYGGGAICRGYQGEWTGQGITGVGLIDDPFKDRASAESAKIRSNVWDWFTDTWWSRLEKGSSCIVQHTRWHDDDLIGRLLKGRFAGYSWVRIRLPAVAEDADDLLGRPIGAPLWPERFDRTELQNIEDSIGPYGWASLYQQRPRPRGADIFGEPARFSLADWRPDGHRILLCADPAATESARADYSAAFVLAARGYGADMEIDVLHGWRGQVSVPTVARKLRDLSLRFWRAPIVVEAVGAFKAVPQILTEIEPTLRLRAATMGGGDKFVRAQGVAAAWNRGKVRIPLDADLEWSPEAGRFLRPAVVTKLRPGVRFGVTWADELIAEAQAFTGVGDVQDDQVDALAHGFNELWGTKPGRRGSDENRNPFG